MLRRYTREKYIQSAHALQATRPGFTLSTDIIVGFPGETDAEFEETLSLVREVGFVAAFGFKYSPRPYTPALKLGDDIPEDVKDDRLARLFDVVSQQQQAHLSSLVGSEVTVLIEGPSRGEDNLWSGRSERNEIVHIPFPKGVDPTGQLLRAKVARANKHSLLGDVDAATIASLAALPASPVSRRLPVLSDSSLG